MDKEYLTQKWLANELTVPEMEVFQDLEDYPMLIDLLDSAQHFKASKFSAMPTYETFRKRLETEQTPVRKMPWIKPMLRIASVFVIGFALYYFFLFNTTSKIQTQSSEKITITLPDASTVMINALSEVRYSKDRWEQNRVIKLDGEAFFAVAKGAKFDVVTSEGTVSVLGTQFNVKQRGTYFEVKCYEGVVRVVSTKVSEELHAGDNFRFSDGKLTLGQNTYQRPQWTKNVSSFQRVPFGEVIAELERQYAIKITLEQVPTELLFTGGFVHDQLDNALKSVTQPLNLKYRMDGSNNVILYPSEK